MHQEVHTRLCLQPVHLLQRLRIKMSLYGVLGGALYLHGQQRHCSVYTPLPDNMTPLSIPIRLYVKVSVH